MDCNTKENRNMKKIALIAALLLILGLTFSSQIIETKKIDTPVEEVVVEDDLQVEDWMTKPFIYIT